MTSSSKGAKESERKLTEMSSRFTHMPSWCRYSMSGIKAFDTMQCEWCISGCVYSVLFYPLWRLSRQSDSCWRHVISLFLSSAPFSSISQYLSRIALQSVIWSREDHILFARYSHCHDKNKGAKITMARVYRGQCDKTVFPMKSKNIDVIVIDMRKVKSFCQHFH